jgi:biotin transport system substrate-specific component
LKITTQQIIAASLFASLTALGAFIAIPAGPVMITLQTFIVILAGILLGSKIGALSQIIYILLGLIGLPIFSGFTGGIQSMMKPSFGFLIGFIFAANYMQVFEY